MATCLKKVTEWKVLQRGLIEVDKTSVWASKRLSRCSSVVVGDEGTKRFDGRNVSFQSYGTTSSIWKLTSDHRASSCSLPVECGVVVEL